MKVIHVPGRLRLSALMLLLAVPIAALETIIALRAPWWKLPYHTMELWCAAVAMMVVPLSAWIQSGKRWALDIVVGILTVWIVLSAWFSVRTHNPALGFFTLFLLLFFGMVASWLDQELGRSYFDPRVRWFEDLPKPIPELACHAELAGNKVLKLRVARMDEEGAFLFNSRADSPPIEEESLASGPGITLGFSFRGREIRCDGSAIRYLRDRRGVGVQFGQLMPDVRKDLCDFVEALKGAGYVE